VKQYEQMGTIVYPIEELARQIDHIIREEAYKPVSQARELQEEMEQWLSEKIGIPVGHDEPDEDAKKKRLENARKPVGSVIRMRGATSGYHRDPITGKVVWDDLPVEYEFRKRHDLSTLIWKAVEEQEDRVLGVIHGGRALGRDGRNIGKDLEYLINYKDGGERVVGRWRGMFPNTEAGRRAGWERDYLKEHGIQPGTEAAKALLRQPDAKAWVDGKMQDMTKRGTPRLPDAVRQYATRVGRAGLDHRAIRIARTETAQMVADEQTKIAENSDICTGEMDWVMDRGRDAWNCNCEKYAGMSPWKVDDPDRPEIPLHPNCMCEWRPRLKTDDEILAAFKEEMAEELGIIEGTEEQKAILDRIDRAMVCSHCGKTFNSKFTNASCPYCGEVFSDNIFEKFKEENAKKAKDFADQEFPGEKWKQLEDGIYISENRSSNAKNNELRDAQILRDGGSTVYLIPEYRDSRDRQYDAIVDGIKMEFKNLITANPITLQDRFLYSREQSPNVFINLENSPLTQKEIYTALYGARNSEDYIKSNKDNQGGVIILKINGIKYLRRHNVDYFYKP